MRLTRTLHVTLTLHTCDRGVLLSCSAAAVSGCASTCRRGAERRVGVRERRVWDTVNTG